MVYRVVPGVVLATLLVGCGGGGGGGSERVVATGGPDTARFTVQPGGVVDVADPLVLVLTSGGSRTRYELEPQSVAGLRDQTAVFRAPGTDVWATVAETESGNGVALSTFGAGQLRRFGPFAEPTVPDPGEFLPAFLLVYGGDYLGHVYVSDSGTLLSTLVGIADLIYRPETDQVFGSIRNRTSNTGTTNYADVSIDNATMSADGRFSGTVSGGAPSGFSASGGEIEGLLVGADGTEMIGGTVFSYANDADVRVEYGVLGAEFITFVR